MRHAFAQVFANVIGNAAKYTARGGQIDVTARPSAERVAIVVRDNGQGISAELLPKVFDLFVQGKQGHRSRTWRGSGSGSRSPSASSRCTAERSGPTATAEGAAARSRSSFPGSRSRRP